jgi:hypothetical protein
MALLLFGGKLPRFDGPASVAGLQWPLGVCLAGGTRARHLAALLPYLKGE